ncbi:MAG: BamA/TamA family outer membrane protein [Crocinitomicaceae bacterium]|nr:BamA/TamA family outer membrane protein [Crocinitomicaceae bacterium]
MLKLTYFLLIVVFLISSCKSVSAIQYPQKHILKKNRIQVSGDHLDQSQLQGVLKQKPNVTFLGIPFRRSIYLMIDSTKVAERRLAINSRIKLKNQKKRKKVSEINKRRIEKAQLSNKSFYTERKLLLKDTLSSRRFFREWLKYKIGEKPVYFDSLLHAKTISQFQIYLKNKGYYSGTVKSDVTFKRKKARVLYTLNTGKAHVIDTVSLVSDSKLVTDLFHQFQKTKNTVALEQSHFDKDILANYRENLAKFMRNHGVYGFNSSIVHFIADTNALQKKVKLTIQISDRIVQNNADSIRELKHALVKINKVYFHLSDTVFYKGNFTRELQKIGLTPVNKQFAATIDTFVYQQIKVKGTDLIDSSRTAVFLYNGSLNVEAPILELQNNLEATSIYNESDLEKTYTRLIQLGVFQMVKPVVVEDFENKTVDIHYYLVQSKEKAWSFSPRFTNSNSYLALSSSINFTNKNIFNGAEKMVFSFGGGFESQPPVFAELDGQLIQQAARSFNTFEIGPSLKFEIPHLFPFGVTRFSKKIRPQTVVSTAYNYQERSDFKRQIFQVNYFWKFYVGKTHVFQTSIPALSVVKYVQISNQPAFQSKLDLLNDLFLKNAYSDQFVWQDWKFTYEYNNKNRTNKKSNLLVYFNTSFDPTGNILSLFSANQDTLKNGQRAVFGVAYSQFIRLDNELICSKPVGKSKSLHTRIQIGAGKPYGNTTTSIPYDYSFFGGGANDNRGWRSRSLGPGSYKYYLDSNRTATQIGDIRIGGSLEYRFSFGKLIKSAAFIDAGNVWTFQEDINRVGGQFSSNWFKEIAVSVGVGVRLDFDFFIVRFDVGMPITNPALPDGEKWIFQPKTKFDAESKAVYGDDYSTLVPYPYIPNFHFGIGYPF